ncbi:hypothetical protein [Mesorhizobium sp. KR1-2]|uniref:hypothetical protein n=1 Tax=Mesorhizobium sp. KR1-2 TaxID=3156609 RepID=UPI0032B3FD99
MSNKLDWRKAEPGRSGPDEITATEWRLGPVDTDLSMPDISYFDLAATPTIEWSRTLRARFRTDDDHGHLDMVKAVLDTVGQVIKRYGVDALKSRARQYRDRASKQRPFPSLWFAFYFDLYAARRYRGLRPGCLLRQSRDKYFTPQEVDVRWRSVMKNAVGYDVVLEMRERAAGRSTQVGKPRKSHPERVKEIFEGYHRQKPGTEI